MISIYSCSFLPTLRWGYVFTRIVSLSGSAPTLADLFLIKLTQNVIDAFWWNIQDSLAMTQGTIDIKLFWGVPDQHQITKCRLPKQFKIYTNASMIHQEPYRVISCSGGGLNSLNGWLSSCFAKAIWVDFRQSFGGSVSIAVQCIETQIMPNESSGTDV